MGEFQALLATLSPDSLYKQVTADQPIELHGEAAQSYIGTL